MFIDVIKLKNKKIVRVTGFKSDSVFSSNDTHKQETSFVFTIEQENTAEMALCEHSDK